MLEVFFLLAINLLGVGWVVVRECLSQKGFEFNHILLFSIGYVFYWLIPICIGSAHLLEAEPGMSLWYSIFNRISQGTIVIYLLTAMCCYLAFWLGSRTGRKVALRKNHAKKVVYIRLFFYLRLLDIFLLLGCVLAFVYAFLLRDQFFRGYAVDVLDIGDVKRGSFTAVSLFLLSLAFLYSVKHNEGLAKPTLSDLFLNRYFVIYFTVAMLVLSLGGRLYFISSLVMLAIYRTNYFQRISGKKFVITLLSLTLAAGAIGSIRQNNSLDLTTVLSGLLSESLFTSFSLIQYLREGVFDILRPPIFLLSDFLNLIPTALLPDKAGLLLDPKDYGYTVLSPLGAQHVFFTFMINFGIVGTLGFLFFMGWFYSYLRYSDRNLLYRVFYVMLTGWLGFTFFRDDFSISLIKSMLQFSILVPGGIVVTLQLVSVFLRTQKRSNTPLLTGEQSQGG